jgi:mediator of RNA polymerase II transcription subunit 31
MNPSGETQFLQDSEFVQALANPDYVVWIAREGYLRRGDFVNYLQYLNYMTSPQYSVHLNYTKGLDVLEILQVCGLRSQYMS